MHMSTGLRRVAVLQGVFHKVGIFPNGKFVFDVFTVLNSVLGWASFVIEPFSSRRTLSESFKISVIECDTKTIVVRCFF